MPPSASSKPDSTEIQRISAAILQLLFDGEKGRTHLAEDVSRMTGIRLSASALLVMHRLATESMRVNDLGAHVDLTSGGITRQIQDLETKGLIDRTTDAKDKRVAIVKLSKKGLDVLRLASAARELSTRLALQGWTDEEVKQELSATEPDRRVDFLLRRTTGSPTPLGIATATFAPVRTITATESPPRATKVPYTKTPVTPTRKPPPTEPPRPTRERPPTGTPTREPAPISVPPTGPAPAPKTEHSNLPGPASLAGAILLQGVYLGGRRSSKR